MIKPVVVVALLGGIASADEPAPVPPVDVPVRPDDQNVDHTPFQYAVPQVTTSIAAPPERAPILITASGYVAGYGYSGHPTRDVGMQSQVRGDVWRGLEWGVHFAYTLDVISADDAMTGSYGATTFHDFNLGSHLDLGLPIPSWAFVELHGMDGSTDYGSGFGGMLGGGVVLPHLVELEAAVGSVWTSGDTGYTGTLRVARKAFVKPWLDVAATVIYTHDAPDNMFITSGGSHVAVDGEVGIGPFGRTRLVFDVTAGDRVFALLDHGQTLENVPDVEHVLARGFVWVDITKKLRGYLGASYRSATAPIATGGKDYSLTSGFTGAVYNF